MAEETPFKQCSYFLVRYVPDVTREEFLNIGLFLYSPEENFLDCLFTDDFRRLRRFHAEADLELLRHLQGHFEDRIKEHETQLSDYIREMQDSYSNLIQVSEPRPCIASDPRNEMQELFARYVGVRASGSPPQDTRMRIKQALRSALDRAGVLKHPLFEKQIPAEPWTQKGDPFTFDFGYRPPQVERPPDGHVRLIHALSLKHDPDIADLLGMKIARVRAKEPAGLTAVVEGLPAPDDETAKYSYGVLEDHKIAIRPLAEVDEFARVIGRELSL